MKRPNVAAMWLLFFFFFSITISSIFISASLSDSDDHHQSSSTPVLTNGRGQEAGASDVERRARGVYGGGDLLRPRTGSKKNAAPISSMITSSPPYLFPAGSMVSVGFSIIILMYL